jgi:hypothetical protein
VHALLSGLLTKAMSAGITAKVAAGAAAVVVAGGGVAATTQALEVDPQATATEVSTTTETTEPTLTTEPTETTEPTQTTEPGLTEKPTETAEPTGTTEPSPTTEPTETADVVEVEDEAAGSSHPDNHGRDVSEVAHQTFDSGREHGEAVSSAARNRSGKGGDDDPTETPEAPETEVELEHADGHTSGNDHRGESGHGKGGKGGKG